MHIVNCMVAIGGDLSNKAYRTGVTTPELMLLEFVHGPGSVSAIEVMENKRVNQMDERERLQHHYPKHIDKIMGMWRDNGGKFLSDVRKIRFINAAQFATSPSQATEKADQIEDEQVAALNAQTSDEEAALI